MGNWKKLFCVLIFLFFSSLFASASRLGAGEELLRSGNCPEGVAVLMNDTHRRIEIETAGGGSMIDIFDEAPDNTRRGPGSLRMREARFFKDRLFLTDQPASLGKERVVLRDMVRLRLFEELQVEAVLSRVDQTESSFTWVGRIRGSRVSGDVNLTFGNGRVLGRVNLHDKGLFKISQLGPGKCLIEEMDPVGVEPAPPLIPGEEFVKDEDEKPEIENATNGIIEVMVIWSLDAESEATAAGYDIRLEIAQAVSLANTAYANSDVFQRLALVSSYRTDYFSSRDTDIDLYRLTGDDDPYMTEVHIQRYANKADCVALVTGNFNDGWAGAGWILTKNNGSSFKYYAFSVMSRNSLFYQTLAHELGHNMGAGHEVDNTTSPGPQYYTFSSGYHYYYEWNTVMSYSHGGSYDIDNFSNPAVYHDGHQTGMSGLNGNDNAYTLDLNLSLVDSFGEDLERPVVGVPVLSSPGKGSKYTTSNPPKQLEWDCAADALRYDVWLEKGDYTPDRKVASGIGTCYWNISPGIYDPGRYYWKVTASNDWDSENSEIWYFDVEGPSVTPPGGELGEISLVSPADGSMYALSEEQLKLDWDDVDNALAYDLYIWDASREVPTVPYASYLSSSFLFVTIKIPALYKWKVVARNNTESKTGPTWEFEILDPEVANDMVIYFPHYIAGENATTGLLLINNCDTTRTGSIFYYGNSTTGLTGTVIKEESFYIGAMEVSSHEWSGNERDVLKTGAIEIVQDGNDKCRVEGLEYFNALGSYTTVNRDRPGNAKQIFAAKSDTRDTGFALFNPNEGPVEIEVIFLTGNDEMKSSVTLGGKGHLAMYLGELFPDAPENCTGTLNFVSDGENRFVMTGLLSIQASPAGLVALPTSSNAYNDGNPGSIYQPLNRENSEISRDDFGTPVLTFPQYIQGEGAGTELILINNCPSAKSGSILLYGQDGTEYQGAMVKAVPFSLDSMDETVEQWYGSSGDSTIVGAIEVIQEGDTGCAVEGVEFFNALGSYTTVGNSAIRESHQIFGLLDDNQDTGFALFNPNDHPISIQVSFEKLPYFNLKATIYMEAKEHQAMFLSELFPADAYWIKGLPGIVDFLEMDNEAFGLVGLFLIDSASNAMVSLPSIPREE